MLVALAGCSAAAPVVTSEWRNPAYSTASFRRIMVGVIGDDASVRRTFEDEFVAQLRSAGVDALPSYRFTPGSDKLDEAELKQAAQKAGADGLLFARLIRVEEKKEYGSSYPSTSIGISGSNVGVGWYGLGGGATVQRYYEYVSETILQDLSKNDMVWTGTLRAKERENVQGTIKSYVETVMKTLREKNLIRSSNGM
jgi:hypothetical protein